MEVKDLCPLCKKGYLEKVEHTQEELGEFTYLRTPHLETWRCQKCYNVFFKKIMLDKS